jgi:hypothetical protein
MTLGFEEFFESSALHDPPVIEDDDFIYVSKGRFGRYSIAKEPAAGRHALAAVDVLFILNYPTSL